MKTQYKTDVLKRARLKRGWTMSELARRVGVTPPIISRIEDGSVQSPKTVAKVAVELGLDLGSLVR